MSGEQDDGDDVGNGADDRAAVEAEAKTFGWAPKEHWRGDPNVWVDADEFVERGRNIRPILQANNKRLLTDLQKANGEIALLRGSVEAQSQTMRDLLDHQSAEIKRQVESRVATLRAEKKAAIKDGDHDLAADLEERLEAAKDELATASAPPPPPAAEKKPGALAGRPLPDDVAPWAREFAEENSDWVNDNKENIRKIHTFQGICEDLFQTTELRGRALLDEAKRQLDETIKPKPKAAKSEGGSGGWSASGGAGGGGGKGYSALPPEARAACDSQEKKFVGKLPDIKTQDDWRKYYAKTYFESTSRT